MPTTAGKTVSPVSIVLIAPAMNVRCRRYPFSSLTVELVMTNATPRLSIVLPVGPATPAARSDFETTLISVLENRGGAAEVIVVHDGGYDDPHDLGDEVRFAIADTDTLVDSIAAGCDAAWGRYVHVLGGGMTVTPRWCDHALEEFTPQTAAVTPVITDDTGAVAAAGWRDTPSRWMTPVLVDASETTAPPTIAIRPAVRHGRSADGVYLHASFWRREVLRSLARACTLTDDVLASAAYSRLARSAGWRTIVADPSIVTATDTAAIWDVIDHGGFNCTRGLSGVQSQFTPQSVIAKLTNGLRRIASEPAEALAHWSTILAPVNLAKSFEPSQVYTADRYRSARQNQTTANQTLRRAA